MDVPPHRVKCVICGQPSELMLAGPTVEGVRLLSLCRPCAQRMVDEHPGEMPTLAAALARDQS